MIIEVPKGYTFIKDENIIAFEEGGKLKLLRRHGKFDEIMYDITYRQKGRNKCYYCGRVNSDIEPLKITLDHIYPRSLGGPTIPQNLIPACRKCNSTKENMTEILKIGIPTLTFQILTSLSIALINRAANGYGDAVIAGMGAVTRISSMGTLVVFGFLKGFQPIAGFSYGAKKFDRLREAIKISTLWSTIFCVVVGLLMAIFSTPAELRLVRFPLVGLH